MSESFYSRANAISGHLTGSYLDDHIPRRDPSMLRQIFEITFWFLLRGFDMLTVSDITLFVGAMPSS